jgi:hypothetical protein
VSASGHRAPPPLPAGPGWRTMPGVSCRPWLNGVARYYGGLSDVSATSAHDAWAVGSCGTYTSPATYVGVVEHWDGRRWSPVRVPAALRYDSVEAFSGHDVWMTGDLKGPAKDGSPSVLHWNGRQWSIATQGVPEGASVKDLAATSPSNLWGLAHFDSAPPQDTDGGEIAIPVHWDGARWRSLAIPHGYNGDVLFAVGSSDMWVGSNSATDVRFPSVAHYDGRRWSELRVPIRKRYGDVMNIAAVGHDLWASGHEEVGLADDDGEPIGQRSFIAHWDGHRWTRPPVRSGCIDGGSLTSDGREGPWLTCPFGQIVHWDGHRWIDQPTPRSAQGVGPPQRVPGTPAYWVVGGDYRSQEQLLIELTGALR